MAHHDIIGSFTNWVYVHREFVIGIFVNIFLIWGICKIIDAINKRLLSRMKAKITDYPLISLLPVMFQTLKFVMAFLLIAVFLQNFGYNVTSIVAGFGITGLAVAFAAQTTIGNVFGSFSILTDKVFKIGDFIQFNETSGRVEGINLRSTQLRTIEGFLVNVPNNVLSNTAIINISQTSRYKIEIPIAIECDTPINTVREALAIIKGIADEDKYIDKEKTVVYVDSVEDTAINLKLFTYTTATTYRQYLEQKSYIIEEILGRFQEKGISLDIPDSRLSIVGERNLPGVFEKE
ncbi:MAG: mechanosensitive ion channel family protein [bacterium]|nr:mechanosensitive ion channel family protein [bacterium]